MAGLVGSLLGIVSALLVGVPNDPNALINTTYGPVQGIVKSGDRHTTYYSFTGIPFALPPVDELRFKDPQLPIPWTQPVDATKECSIPYGLDVFMSSIQFGATEDCLHLNVYTKSVHKDAKQPVLFFLYGGGFLNGQSGQYGPDFLLEQNVVVVTANYRVGAFGFLSIDDIGAGVPGNAGLKDQRMALKWVQANIDRFGGDPNRVTLFGHSAGAASAHYHTMSDGSRGLFHGVILESGSAFNPWARTNKAASMAERLARALGWNGFGGTTAMMSVLQRAKPADIVNSQNVQTPKEILSGEVFVFVPVIEPYELEAGTCFLCAHPNELAATAWGNQLPMLTGGTSSEGYLMFDYYVESSKIMKATNPADDFLPSGFNYAAGHPMRLAVAEQLSQFYGLHLPFNSFNIDQIVPLVGDQLIWHGVDQTVNVRLSAGAAPTYLYHFGYDSKVQIIMKLAMAGTLLTPDGTAVHAEELQFLQNLRGLNTNQFGDDLFISRLMCKMWAQFAAIGDPNVDELKLLNWRPVEKTDQPKKCLNLNVKPSVINLPETDRIAEWNWIKSMSTEL